MEVVTTARLRVPASPGTLRRGQGRCARTPGGPFGEIVFFNDLTGSGRTNANDESGSTFFWSSKVP